MKSTLLNLLLVILLIHSAASAAVKNEGDYSPTFSPKGDYLAYHSHSAEHFFDLMLRNLATGEIQNITNNQGYDTDASWSPDGKQLVFSSSQSGQWDIYLYDLASQKTSLLITNPAMDNQPRWSPDGQSIAFLSRREGNSQVYLFDMKSQRQTRLSHTENSIFHPSWSGDNKSIIFDQNIDNKSAIYQLDVSSGKSVKLFEAEGSSISGKLIHNKLYVTTKRELSWDIIEFDLTTKKSVDLVATPADEMKADIDLKRNRLVYSKINAEGIAKIEIQTLN